MKRWLAFPIGASIACLGICAAIAPWQTVLAAAAGATLAVIATTWRTRPILAAAYKLAGAYCFTDGCIPELRDLSKAVLTWRKI